MLKILAVGSLPLLLALPFRCEGHERGTYATFEEMEVCTKIGAEWLSSTGRAGTEDWYYIKRCSIDARDRKPTEVRIHVVSSVDLDVESLPDLHGKDANVCSELEDLESAVRSVMNAPVSVVPALSDSRSTCAHAGATAWFRPGNRS